MVFVAADSEAFAKWKARKGNLRPRLCRVGGQTKNGCWFKSEFPPHQQAERMALVA
jgi:hypothetical protein